MRKRVEQLFQTITNCDRRQKEIQQQRSALHKEEEQLVRQRDDARAELRQLQQKIPAGRRQKR